MNTPVISVVVPTCGRPQLLRRCLLALIRQQPSTPSYEIIVVDDGHSTSGRQLVATLKMLPHNPAMLYLRSKRQHGGPAAARNLGWRAARGEIIAFTDDDTIPARDWLHQGVSALRPELAAVTGRVQVPIPSRPTDWERNTAGLEHCAEFVTANCFVRRAAMEQIGGFDERFVKPWREDSDLHFALLEHGLNIDRAPDARVLHPVRPAPWGISLRLQHNVVFDALLYKKHRGLYRKRIAARPPIRYYFAVAALLLGLLGGALLSPLIAVVGVLLWLSWTLWFALKRLRGASLAPRHVAEMMFTSALIPPLAIFWRLAGAWRYRVVFI